MHSAYERPPVDRRVRKRLRTGLGGTAGPGTAGHCRAAPQDRRFSTQTARVDVAPFSDQDWHFLEGIFVFVVKKNPLWKGEIFFYNNKIGAASGAFLEQKSVLDI